MLGFIILWIKIDKIIKISKKFYTMDSKSNRLVFPDAIAAIGILFVVLSHLQFPSDRNIELIFKNFIPISLGNIGVLFFFMRSGYLLYYSKKNNWMAFYKKRILKIIPALFIFTIITVLISLLIFNKVIFLKDGKISLKILVANSFGIQHLFNIEGLNGSTWFISVILLFYLFFPLIVWLVNKNMKSIILLFLLIIMLFPLSKAEIFSHSHLSLLYYYLILFISGILFAKYENYIIKIKYFKTFSAILFFYALFYFYLMIRDIFFFEESPQLIVIRRIIDALLTLVSFYFFSKIDYGNLASKIFTFMADYSYYIFIVHFPIFYFLSSLNNIALYFALFFIIAAFSCVFLRFFDNLIKKVFNYENKN